MAYDTVPHGRYYGKTKEEIVALIAAVQAEDAAAPGAMGAIVELSVNGRSVKYDPRFGPVTAAARLGELFEALCMVDDDALVVTNTQTATMRTGKTVYPYPTVA